jgi:hypothetical protein
MIYVGFSLGMLVGVLVVLLSQWLAHVMIVFYWYYWMDKRKRK